MKKVLAPTRTDAGVRVEFCENPRCSAVHLCFFEGGDEFSFAISDPDWDSLFLEVAKLQQSRAGRPQ